MVPKINQTFISNFRLFERLVRIVSNLMKNDLRENEIQENKLKRINTKFI